ncbi:MAG: DNA mismatch repair endonuclease MutH [Byssovorax sp.]
MRAPPPRDERELCERARAIAGRSLGDLAAAIGLSLEGEGARTKGKQGELLERVLGATSGSRAEPDFPGLGVELKTIPVDEAGRPRESTFVCALSLGSADRAAWASSVARAKLSCVLWVPIVGRPGVPVAERRIGQSSIWRPTREQAAVLADDFDAIVGLIGAGHVEALTARLGRFLQARPKAAHGGARTWAYGADGARFEALPRGLYLRARFTGAILVDPAAMPA